MAEQFNSDKINDKINLLLVVNKTLFEIKLQIKFISKRPTLSL